MQIFALIFVQDRTLASIIYYEYLDVLAVVNWLSPGAGYVVCNSLHRVTTLGVVQLSMWLYSSCEYHYPRACVSSYDRCR